MTHPLTEEDLGKLVAGKSVLRVEEPGAAFEAHQIVLFKAFAGGASILIDLMGKEFCGLTLFEASADRFTPIGTLTEDGWIEGEWWENPVPGMLVEVRLRGGATMTCESDFVSWTRPAFPAAPAPGGRGDIIAFRPAQREAEGQQSGISGELNEPRGAAEPEVGRAVYERIEALIGSQVGTPAARELAYLTYIVESVEEVGGYDGPRPDDLFSAEAILARLADSLSERGIDPASFNDPGIAAVFLVDHHRSKPAQPEPATGEVDRAALIIMQIAEIARAVGWQAGEPGMEIAGGIVSHLAANPDQIDRFLKEGGDMFVNGEIRAETGALTWRSTTGEMMDADKYQDRLAALGKTSREVG